MFQEPPDARVMLSDDAADRSHCEAIARQFHDQRFEQEGEVSPGPCPRHVDLQHAMLVTFRARLPRLHIGQILKEVQMSPRLRRGIVDLAGGAALGTRERAPRREVDFDVEPLLFGIKMQIRHLPGINQPEGDSKKRVHI